LNLEVSNLCCGYERDILIVKNASFELSGGDICCILGRNGSGKSTLFKTILKLIKPLSGRVCIDGEDIKDWSPKRMAAVSAYVSQSHIPPFPYLVEEMVMFGRSGNLGAFGQPGKEDFKIVDAILDEMGIYHLKKKVYTEISGGERQMTMIARALAQRPRLLVLDEPTANLDYGNKVLLMEKLKLLSEKGICVIFTTHDPEQALLLGAKTLMLRRNEPPLFGCAVSVITEKTLKEAYLANIRVIEIVDEDGWPTRVCLPMLKH